MTEYVVDSWAWIEYLGGTAKGTKVKEVVEGGADILTSAVSMAEVVSKLRRAGRDFQAAAERIAALSRVVAPDRLAAIAAGSIHAEMRRKAPNFSLADAFVLQAARSRGGKVLTGDPDFKGIEGAELLK